MKVQALKGGIRRIWVEVPPEVEGTVPEKVWVDYRPGELTLEMSDTLKDTMATSGFESDVAGLLLEPLLTDWDVEDEVDVLDAEQRPTGEKRTVHLTPQNGGLKKVPLSFLGLVMEAIMADSIPNAPRDAISAGSLPQKDEPAPSQTSTQSSEQQTDSDASPGSS
jgi:hypothetical protein